MKKLKRIKTGDRISAESWNELCEMVERAANLNVSQGLSMIDGPAGRMLAVDQLILQGVPFLNNSGETVPPWGVMEVTGSTGGIVDIRKPTTAFKRMYLVNGDSEVGNGVVGTGTWLNDDLGGYALYETGSSPAYGEQWGAKPAQWTLSKNRPGFEIIGSVTGTGATSRVQCRQEYVKSLKGKPVGNISKGSPGTALIWIRSSAGTRVVSDFAAIDVKAWGAAVTGGATAKICSMDWDSGEWVIGPWEC